MNVHALNKQCSELHQTLPIAAIPRLADPMRQVSKSRSAEVVGEVSTWELPKMTNLSSNKIRLKKLLNSPRNNWSKFWYGIQRKTKNSESVLKKLVLFLQTSWKQMTSWSKSPCRRFPLTRRGETQSLASRALSTRRILISTARLSRKLNCSSSLMRVSFWEEMNLLQVVLRQLVILLSKTVESKLRLKKSWNRKMDKIALTMLQIKGKLTRRSTCLSLQLGHSISWVVTQSHKSTISCLAGKTNHY